MITFVGRDAETEAEFMRERDAHADAFIVNDYPSDRVYHVASCTHVRESDPTRSLTAYPKHLYFSLSELRQGQPHARACLSCAPDSRQE